MNKKILSVLSVCAAFIFAGNCIFTTVFAEGEETEIITETMTETTVASETEQVSETSEVSVNPDHKCGDYAEWSFDEETGTLNITGIGAVTSGSWVSKEPGNNAVFIDMDGTSKIRHVVIGEGITALYGAGYIGVSPETITLPESLTYIDKGYFSYFGNNGSAFQLHEIVIPAAVTYIGENAFNSYFSGDGNITTSYDDFKIKGYTYAAENYANLNKIKYVKADEESVEETSENSETTENSTETEAVIETEKAEEIAQAEPEITEVITEAEEKISETLEVTRHEFSKGNEDMALNIALIAAAVLSVVGFIIVLSHSINKKKGN